MNSIDTNIISSLGIQLDSPQQAKLIDFFQAALKERVGYSIVSMLDDAQAKRLVELTKQKDSLAMSQWLSQNISDYQQIIKDEYDILLGDLELVASQV